MKRIKGSTLSAIFFFSASLIFLGVLWKINHWPGGTIPLLAGMAATIVFIGIALGEVTTSRRIDRMEKILWTIGFLFAGTLTGLLYLFMGRKRVVG